MQIGVIHLVFISGWCGLLVLLFRSGFGIFVVGISSLIQLRILLLQVVSD